MQRGEHLLLHFAIEIDEQIPTGDQIEAREGRILEEAVIRKKEKIPQLAFHTIEFGIFCEEPLEPLLTDIRCDSIRITPFTGNGESV